MKTLLCYIIVPSLSRGNIQVYVKPGSHAWDARFQVTLNADCIGCTMLTVWNYV